MIYSVNFIDLAEKINPLAFSRYLKQTEWEHYQSKKTTVKIFQKETETDFYQVIIPMDKKLVDYKTAMYKAVATVAQAENKSIEQVLLYLLNPNSDILKIRLAKSDTEAGNILFDDAIRIYENAKKLLAATAQDILNPKKYHQGRMDEAVTKFLSSCRFGQTEIGSYVVSVVCPFAELDEDLRYKQLSIFSDEEDCADSLTRQVTSRIIDNLAYIKNQIDSCDTDKLASAEGNEIISANFYEAVNGLNLDSEDATVEVIAEWSPNVKNDKCSANRVTLTHDYYQPIEAVIAKLKEEKKQSSKIMGRIKKLESVPDVAQRTMGKATIVYLDDNNKRKTVSVMLDKNDYDKAIEAHACGSQVRVVGELVVGRKSTITCESFSILD